MAGQTEKARQLLANWEEVLATPSSDHRELLRLLFFGTLLVDLQEAGWEIEKEGGQLYVVAPIAQGPSPRSTAELRRKKSVVRRSMVARLRDQLSEPSTANLVDEVEQDNAKRILTLVADGAALASALSKKGPEAIQPYLQLARGTDGSCPHSGLRLHSIYRYFRTIWSFPAASTPGRSLPMLVRDAGQPGHPVCGLLCLSSPVLRLRVRDEELGLGTSWLEALVAALDINPADEPCQVRSHLLAVGRALSRLHRRRQPAPRAQRLAQDLSTLLGLSEAVDLSVLARSIRCMEPTELNRRVEAARRTLARELIDEVDLLIDQISLEGLELSPAQLREHPEEAQQLLKNIGAVARQNWEEAQRTLQSAKREHRRLKQMAGADVSDDEELASLLEVSQAQLAEFSDRCSSELFRKKRALQLAGALQARASLRPLATALSGDPGEAQVSRLQEELRALTSQRTGPVGPALRLAAGVDVSPGLKTAIELRKTRLAASQLAEVSICGAVPPYGPILGGKLVALLALSREVAIAWEQAYAGAVSTIQSRMAGESIVRPSELLALSTTSLYSAGSSQYNRAVLPRSLGGARWQQVGVSAGHGTLHLSQRLVQLAHALINAEKGRVLVTSTFGEGPSERLRKLRQAMALLGLPSQELLRHGMQRIVFVARVSSQMAPIGSEAGATPPSLAEVVAFWRQRWLSPRWSREEIRREVGAHQRDAVLLTTRFASEVALAYQRRDTHNEPEANETGEE